MIDAARTLRDQVAAEATLHETEAGRLRAFAAELDAFIEQPGQGDERALPSADTPDPAPTTPAPSVAGQDAPASDGEAGRARASASPTSSFPCPECSFVGRTVNGLGVHRARKHQVAGPSATTREKVERTGQIPPAPIGAAKNGHPSARESFLCGRCSRAFPTREALRQHETQVDCQPVPTRPPTSMRETHEAALAASGILAGLGE